jgi:hypothetical protein
MCFSSAFYVRFDGKSADKFRAQRPDAVAMGRQACLPGDTVAPFPRTVIGELYRTGSCLFQ